MGYDVSPMIDSHEITVPEEFDDVYENYNEVQLEAGFDLRPYCGRRLTMCTYEIYDHPFGKVFAHVLLSGGRVVGGDISSTAIDGFMQGLM